MGYLEQTFDFCEKELIGQSHEGQDMIVMKVCKGGCGNKPAMWIDSGIHAREWISPATGTWMLNEVVENDARHPELTESLDWYFLPSATRTATESHVTTIACGERPRPNTTVTSAKELMPTGTGTSTGPRPEPLAIAAPRHIMALNPSRRLRIAMSATL